MKFGEFRKSVNEIPFSTRDRVVRVIVNGMSTTAHL